ncbi:hypothetical protein PHISCL_01186 [Aspergillus sclerotialis]|uniref:Uncharacterized protein n=1 Tax=Aspergillus sclerotialis TaxID=2070753 RepID=A0A3A2ZTS3_9EURO|nr:hypothetical protein PHISCL_01186 [Aspergillus sclerotialis]
MTTAVNLLKAYPLQAWSPTDKKAKNIHVFIAGLVKIPGQDPEPAIGTYKVFGIQAFSRLMLVEVYGEPRTMKSRNDEPEPTT